MSNKLTKLIHFCYQALFFLTPLLLSPQSSEIFELPKMYFVYALTTIIVTLWLFRMVLEKRFILRRTFMDLPLFLFLLSQIASTLISADPHTSLNGYYSRFHGGLYSTISYLLLYLAFVSNPRPSPSKTILYPSFASALLVSLWGIAEHFGADKTLWVQDVQNRVFSTLGQPNWLAAYLAILLPFSLNFLKNAISQKSHPKSILYLLLSSSFLICLLYTRSKSGFLAFVASLLLYFFLTLLPGLKKTNTRSRLSPPLLALLPLVLLVIFLGSPFTPRLTNLLRGQIKIDAPPPPTFNITPSEDIRKIVWRGAWDLFRQYPVLGTGVETFAYSYYWVRPQAHNLTSEWDFLYNKAHNEYLNFLATTGALGFITFLLLHLSIFIKLIQNYLSQKLNSHHNYLPPLAAAYLAIIITNLAGFSVTVVALYFFLLPSLLLSPSKEKEEKIPKQLPLVPLLIILLLSFLSFKKIVSFIKADYHYNLAGHFEKGNYLTQAHEQITKALALKSNEAIYYSRAAQIDASLAYLAKDQEMASLSATLAQTAVDLSQKALSLSPFHLNLYKDQARIYLILANLNPDLEKMALNTLLKAQTLAPTDPKITLNLASLYQAAADIPQTQIYLEKTVALKPNWEQARFSLGRFYLEQGKKEKAQKEFQYILDNLNPQNQEAKQYLDQT